MWLAAATIPTAAALVVFLIWLLGSRRVTPEERERRRRLKVNALGRITDGLITDVETIHTASGAILHLLHFSYTLSGVTYSAAQDITTLLAHLDGDPGRIAGAASVKYLPGNPSNSIVICEDWSGISRRQVMTTGCTEPQP